MIEIGMNNIVKNYGYKNVLDGASLEIMTGERACLVGRNGSGKSTLFKIIAGEENVTSGTVSLRRGATVGYLEQIPTLPKDKNATTRQVLCQPFAEVMAVEAELRRLEAEMAGDGTPDGLEKLMEAYEAAQNRFTALDGWAMEESFGKIATGFGLVELLERPFAKLSGGQKTIVKLAATLLLQPSILLLDEPTNHLDVDTLEWFEGFLAKYRGTVVIISHDRYFLDRVATKTIVLEAGSCTTFKGNYSFSMAEQERLMLLEFEQYKNQQKKIDAMKAAIRRYREWGTQGDNAKFFKKANELEKRLEKMDMIERPRLEKELVPLHFAGGRTGREVLLLEDYSLQLGGLCLLQHTGFTLYEKDKACLMGGNGSGKTSLLRALLGQGQGGSGKVVWNPSVKMGYIPQEIRFDNDKATVLDTFRAAYTCSEGVARGLLAKFFFYGDSVYKRVGSLSGGEKVLLMLAALIQKQINLLILDEPTNHIDIELREMLEQALRDYTGTLLFVSHDRYFINVIATRILDICEQEIRSFAGGYDDYRRQVAPPQEEPPPQPKGKAGRR